jgi:hypothetical protein
MPDLGTDWAPGLLLLNGFIAQLGPAAIAMATVAAVGFAIRTLRKQFGW